MKELQSRLIAVKGGIIMLDLNILSNESTFITQKHTI